MSALPTKHKKCVGVQSYTMKSGCGFGIVYPCEKSPFLRTGIFIFSLYYFLNDLFRYSVGEQPILLLKNEEK